LTTQDFVARKFQDLNFEIFTLWEGYEFLAYRHMVEGRRPKDRSQGNPEKRMQNVRKHFAERDERIQT